MASERVSTGRPLPAAIGRYRITGRLGKGAMGVVYGAHDDVMDRPVAVKVMMADLEEDPETSARFYREARAAGQLVHRNIITIFDMGEDDGRPFIVMELIDGETLGEHLKAAEASRLEHKLDLMVQICEGLRAAHARGICHRDVKPGNLVVRRDGCLKILDFGIARIASSSMTASGLIIGTPDYMSPEQALGKDIDHRSDIFSAGGVFYFMLTGRKPFAAQDLPAVFNKVTREDPLPVRESEAPAAVARMVMKALAKNPDERFQHCDEIIAELGRIRRHLAADASRHAADLRRQLPALAVRFAEHAAALERLCVTDGTSDAVLAWRDLRQRHAWIEKWIDDRVPAEAVSRELVTQAQSELARIQQQLTAEIEALEQAERALADGRRALATGQPRAALAHLELGARLAPESGVLGTEVERCRRTVAERAANDERARATLREAQQASTERRWDVALALCEEALRLSGDVTEAGTLRDEVLGRQRAEAQERESACARALAEATTLMRRRLFAEAAAALAVARTAMPESPAVRALEDELDAARLEAERATERQRQAAQTIAAARHEFAAGRRREAIGMLETFARQQPEATGVREEVARLEAEARRLEDAERRTAEAAGHADAAEAALANNDPTQALARADQALTLEPGQSRAARVHALAAAQIKAAAERKARAESAARLLGEAREEMARNRFKKARNLVQQADALVPGSEEAAGVLTAIGQREAQAAADEERARIAGQRARAAAPALALARAAEAREDFVRAAWLAENALALDHDCADARDILERARARLAAQPALADETVDLVKEGGRAADPEDTVNIGRALPPWRRVADAIRSWSAGDAPPRASHASDDVRRRSKARF